MSVEIIQSITAEKLMYLSESGFSLAAQLIVV